MAETIGEMEKTTVLIVDDSPDDLALISVLLKDLYEVKIANSGGQALKVAMRGKTPDIILLDIMMPGMDGYETCRLLKATPETLNIPVIFLTAKTDIEDEMKGFELGAVDYITKPISPPIVLARVKTHLQLKRVQDYLQDKSAFLEEEVQRRTKVIARTEGALKESEARYRQLFDTSPDGIVLVGPDGCILQANIAQGQMYRYDPPSDLIGVHATQLVALSSRDYSVQIMRRRLNGEDIQPVEYELVRKDGTTFFGEISATILRKSDGTVSGYICVTHDITDRRRAKEEIEALNAELEQRVLKRTAQLEAVNKELESFSYSVSHDLRAPLRAIDGFSETLLEDYGQMLDDQGRDYLDRVRRAAQHMGRLIEDLLKLSRITRMEFQGEKVDLSALVRSVAEMCRQNNPRQVVDLLIQEGVVVWGDSNLLRIAITNLLDNAWKFTSHTTHPRIEFGVTVKDGKAVHYIQDNGAGFDMANINKLFDAFQRFHSANEFPGTGIGLATVKRIMDLHGGRIWAESEIHKGATFFLTLP